MGDTIAGIATKAQRYGYGGNDDNTRLKAFVVDEYMDTFYAAKWSFHENLVNLTLAAAASSATVPTGSYQYGEIKRVVTPANDQYEPPSFIDYTEDGDIEFVNYPVLSVGRPTRYTIFAGTVYFDKVADQQYVYQFYRWNEPTSLADGDEPLVPHYGREVLMWGALMRQALRDKDDAQVARFKALRDEKLLQLKEADIQGRPKARARLSDEYGRAYD